MRTWLYLLLSESVVLTSRPSTAATHSLFRWRARSHSFGPLCSSILSSAISVVLRPLWASALTCRYHDRC
ncbi:hypothetical protein PR003_g16519 [Phytophthora rubi]|uniref:RxLR effector protein n=1 Tax=Phytophthora rubi TaxID=129364 RepID=A0A6A4EFT2_9STRA|nr:hypothetical protein PR002_g16158 [Phytophthora rubi]KAE9016204.1 hypothetical protein PR001_g14715 [Phytophthora rubi]KAE9325279.1 hypothetical protein PR003_g16519 [Phytophthora rubi]